MRKIKLFLLPVTGTVIVVTILNLLNVLPRGWRPAVYIFGAVIGLLPLTADIFGALRRGKVDLGIPVLATILILLFLQEYLIGDVFVLLIVLGNVFKEYILWRVDESINAISHALPDVAYRKTDDVREVHIRDIRVGDQLVVKAGGRVPVDGILLTDGATLDESVITGESKLVSKEKGAVLVAGSINEAGLFEMRVTHTGDESTLAQIHKMVADAQRHSSALSRFTDRFALGNAAVALAGTVVIYFVTKDILHALAFWIALVPVVFAVIVPVATTIGISMLARRGVMVKTGEALENLTKIDSIVFDKTGTLTRGQPEIDKVIVLDTGYDEGALLQLAASVEKYSEHPLAKAFLRGAEALKLAIVPVTSVQILEGKGLQGVCAGKTVAIGNAHLANDLGIRFSSAMEEELKDRAAAGSTPVFVAVDGKAAGVVFLADQLRDHMVETMAALRAMGEKLTMITGDNRMVAERVARELGLTRFYAETLPQDKIRYIKEFKDKGEKVVMIGDGINDAPAISEANVGIAMGLRGTDITLNSAKVVLVHDDIGTLPYVLTVSKKVLGIIRWDLYLATSIHVVAAVLSAAGIISLLGSALIHQVSSVAVLLNTVRLYSLRK